MLWVQMVGFAILLFSQNDFKNGPSQHGIYEEPMYHLTVLGDGRKTWVMQSYDECRETGRKRADDYMQTGIRTEVEKVAKKYDVPISMLHVRYVVVCVKKTDWDYANKTHTQITLEDGMMIWTDMK